MFDLSIVLPTRNRADQLLKTLMGIERSTHCAYEVIVVDGASADATSDVLLLAGSIMGTRLRAIREGRRVGFASACNKGISLARGRNVCVLHDDVHPLDGALDRAVAQLDGTSGDAATIIALFAPPDATMDVALTRIEAGKPFSVSHVAGTLVAEYPLARRTTFGLMPFDMALQTTAATIDFSLRAWDAGQRIVPASDSLLAEHFADATTANPVDRSELKTVIAHWNLPTRAAFDLAMPCTLSRAKRKAA